MRQAGPIRVVVALAALLLLCAPACAQDAYPSKTITMIVPFAAGGSTDVIGRLLAEGLRTVLGQPVVVDNRAGAGGSLGTAAIAKAPPDGYTIGMGTASTLAINPATYKSLPFDVLADLAPIGNIAAVPNIMSINPGVPAADMAAFIALAKSQPGRLAYASPGHGSVGHLLGEQFKLATGTDLLHVPYRGMGLALNDAIGGQVQVIYDNLPTSLELVKSDKLRALGVSGERRVAALPSVPTFGELGLADINWMAFFGLIAPKDTPAPVVKRLNEALVQVLAMPDIRDKLAAQQADVVGNSPDAFRAEIARELARMKRAVAAAKIELN
ncbi:MAG: tripartite tricarboxylate transporter substrate-binding protein [Alphaproteobacteria bacterium]|nr:tripartite tricarboxylate transporter substrate-binding protein [Alphaproteobacteria bacterium]